LEKKESNFDKKKREKRNEKKSKEGKVGKKWKSAQKQTWKKKEECIVDYYCNPRWS